MTISLSLRRLCAAAPLWALAGLLLSGMAARAADPAPKRRQMENRFLFVVDTSAAMKSRAKGVLEAVTGLLASGMKGELRKGDTIGVWTYADTLDTDFPRQIWSDDKKEEIVQKTREFLGSLQYEKRARLDRVLPDITNLAAHSQRLTVIFVFDGSEPFMGTPFDAILNNLHKQYARQFRSEHEPFVTILVAREGRIFDYTINHPSVVVVPHIAEPTPQPETNAAPPVMAVAPPLSPAAPPAPDAIAPPHRREIILSGSNFPHSAAEPPAVTNAPPVVVTAPPASPTVPPAVASTPPVAANVSPAAPSLPPEAAPPVVSNPAPSVAPPPATAPDANAIVSAPDTRIASPAPPATLTPPPALATASTPAPEPAGRQTALYIIAFSLLTIAVVLVLFFVRHLRGGSRSSLISQSMDRPK
jgi:hypothetical protein